MRIFALMFLALLSTGNVRADDGGDDLLYFHILATHGEKVGELCYGVSAKHERHAREAANGAVLDFFPKEKRWVAHEVRPLGKLKYVSPTKCFITENGAERGVKLMLEVAD